MVKNRMTHSEPGERRLASRPHVTYNELKNRAQTKTIFKREYYAGDGKLQNKVNE